MELVLIACAILVLNYVLTFIQLKYYRKAMNDLIRKYKGNDDYFLCSGQSRKKFRAGSMAMLIVDKDYIIRECQVMKGISILSNFKKTDRYNGHHIGEVLEEIQEIYGSLKENKVPAKYSAMQKAAENALLTISKDKSESAS